MTTDVRRVRDGAVAAAALRAVSGSAAPEVHLARVLADDDALLVVAYADGLPVGFAQAQRIPRLKTEGAKLLLYEIDVRAAHRGRGHGRALLAAVTAHARATDCAATWLVTNASNGPAMELYRAAGGRRPARDDVVFVFD